MERLIQVENIVKSFRDKKHQVLAVDHVSLHLDEGEIVGIIGESGSGKSTICDCYLGSLSQMKEK